MKAHAAAGAPVDAVTVQNEPQNRKPAGYPGMFMSAAQQARFIAILGPALRQAGLRTKILAYDHNWQMHPGDIEATPPGEAVETWPRSRALDDGVRQLGPGAMTATAGPTGDGAANLVDVREYS